MILHMQAAVAILLTAVSFTPQSSRGPDSSDAGRFVAGGSITLRLEYSSGPVCELTAHVDVSAAIIRRSSAALSCDRRQAHRTLTPKEADDFLRLARDSRLYRVRGIGRDGRAGDAWLATIKVEDKGQIVILVISGNREFDSGPRRELLQLLQGLLTELRPLLKSAHGK